MRVIRMGVCCGGSFGYPRTSRWRAVVMMQAAEHRDRGDAGGTREQNAVTGNRDPLAESLVRPRLVEVAEGIFPQHVYQVALAQDDQVVDTLAPHAPKESLAHGIHQRR